MPALPCSTFKTAVITFTPPSITPKNGYKVKWRVIGETTWNTYPNQTSNPINVVGVPACYNIEVSIAADGDGAVCSEVIVPVSGAVTECWQYILLQDNNTYTYTPCNSTIPVSIAITESMSTAERTVCAISGTVTGGTFTQSAQCVN